MHVAVRQFRFDTHYIQQILGWSQEAESLCLCPSYPPSARQRREMAKRAVSFAQSTKVQGIAFDLRSHDIDDASTNDAESSIDDKSSQTVNTWVSTHCTFPMPADDNEETYEPTQVPLRTVFNLLDRDGSRTIDVREFCAILQALNPSGDLSIRKLIHCFPTAVLRPRDAEDERRL